MAMSGMADEVDARVQEIEVAAEPRRRRVRRAVESEAVQPEEVVATPPTEFGEPFCRQFFDSLEVAVGAGERWVGDLATGYSASSVVTNHGREFRCILSGPAQGLIYLMGGLPGGVERLVWDEAMKAWTLHGKEFPLVRR